jgi:hypothetical protein
MRPAYDDDARAPSEAELPPDVSLGTGERYLQSLGALSLHREQRRLQQVLAGHGVRLPTAAERRAYRAPSTDTE